MTTIAEPTCGAALVRMLRPGTKPWAASCGGELAEDVVEDPSLRRREVFPRRRRIALAAALLGDEEVDVVADGGRFGVECEPAERGTATPSAAATSARGGEQREALACRRSRLLAPVRPAPPRRRAEEDDVGRMVVRDAGGVLLCLRRSAAAFFSALMGPAGLAVGLDRPLGQDDGRRAVPAGSRPSARRSRGCSPDPPA